MEQSNIEQKLEILANMLGKFIVETNANFSTLKTDVATLKTDVATLQLQQEKIHKILIKQEVTLSNLETILKERVLPTLEEHDHRIAALEEAA